MVYNDTVIQYGYKPFLYLRRFAVEITVYVDIYLFVSLLVNGSLICITGKLIGNKIKVSRFIISDMIASAFSFVICLPSMGIFLSLLVKFVSSEAVSFSAFKPRSIIVLLKNAFIFLSVVTSYSAFAMWFVTLIRLKSIVYINNNEIYFGIPVHVIILITMILMVIYSVVKRVISYRTSESLIYECCISHGGKQTDTKAFMDTGNSLRDVISGLPVIIIGRRLADNLLNDTESFLNLSTYDEKLKIVPYMTADGKRNIMPAFRPDKVTVNGKDVDVLVAVSREDFELKYDYNCLLNINCII